MTGTPLGAVRAYLDAFNAGDPAAMSAAFAADGSILDGMAPHLWQGPTAVADWYRDVMAESAHLGASGYRVTLGEPLHNDVTAASAYVVAPATMTFDLNGTPITQTGAVFTVALRRVADGWRVAAWAKGPAHAMTDASALELDDIQHIVLTRTPAITAATNSCRSTPRPAGGRGCPS